MSEDHARNRGNMGFENHAVGLVGQLSHLKILEG
jgi:hypothetical protein